MSSFHHTMNTLEQLPDELLLLICRYLSSPDILFSFYGLNSRLSQTISGYCRHVVLAEVPFKRFNYICASILPEIDANICSLVISNQWKGILSKIFLSYFNERMFLAFPCLKRLTLVGFKSQSLLSFLDYLQNLTELFEIIILSLFTDIEDLDELQTVLHRVLIANNNRLNSIILESYAIAIGADNKYNDISFSSIRKLHVNLKTINDLHRILTTLPQLDYLQTKIDEGSIEFHEENQYIKVPSLKYFHLQSFSVSWNLDGLASIIQRIPNIEELSIAIESNSDMRLVDGEKFFSLLSDLPLKKFNYSLEFSNSSYSFDHTKILSTWHQFKQEFVCIKSDDNNTLVLFTLPFTFSYLILLNILAKKEVFVENYAPQVKDLILCHVSTQIVAIFSVIKKCHRIHVLDLRMNENIVPSKISSFVYNKTNFFCL